MALLKSAGLQAVQMEAMSRWCHLERVYIYHCCDELSLSAPQIVFEAVTSGQRGLLAIKDVVLQGHQCSKFRLLRP